MLSSKDIEFLNRVEREGTNKRRFDELDFANTWATKHYNYTSSIFIYDYNNSKVFIVKEKGEFISYFIQNLSLESEV